MSTSTSTTVTKNQLNFISFLKTAREYFLRHPNRKFGAAKDLGCLNFQEFKTKLTADSSIFTALETLACRNGHLTNGTFGGLQQSVGLTQSHACELGCACHGETITGLEIAKRIDNILNH